MNDVVEVIQKDDASSISRLDDSQLDIYLKIHDKVNSCSEEISKSYKNNLLVEFKDIKELHLKTLQSIESINPAKNNTGIQIAVSHNEGESEKFNSFEEFEKHNTTSPNPTSNIILKYTFAIYDVKSGSFENYKIINTIMSRIAELQQIEKEAPGFISRAIITSLLTTTARITIQYSDYVKARHFTAMFDEWVKGCDESNNIKIIDNLKKISHLIPTVGILIIYILMALFTVSAMSNNPVNADLVVKFGVIYASAFLVVRGVSREFLASIAISINGYLAISYLNINKGDAKLIKSYSSRNTKAKIVVAVGVIGTISIGLATSTIYDIIKWILVW